MGKRQKTPVHRQPPLGGSHNFHAGFGVVTGRSSDLQAWPINVTGVSTGPSSRFQRKPVVFGFSILLTAAGQSRIRTGFPLTFPWERHQQTNHKIEGCLSAVNQNVAVLVVLVIAAKSVSERNARVRECERRRLRKHRREGNFRSSAPCARRLRACSVRYSDGHP